MKKLILSICAAVAMQAGAQNMQPDTLSQREMSQQEYELYLNTIPGDTAKQTRIDTHTFRLESMARAKGDKGVILRWAPPEYAPWVFINEWGYRVLRQHYAADGSLQTDTLKAHFRPMPLEDMQKHFQPTDSLAGAAAQLLYGKEDPDAQYPGKHDKSIMEQIEDQQTKFAYAMLLSEIRPDLAEAMALRYVDRTAKAGQRYEYIITTEMPDSIMRITTSPVEVVNIAEPMPIFQGEVTDSIGSDGRSILVRWPLTPLFSTFDIERSDDGGSSWRKLNEHPFLTLQTSDEQAMTHHLFNDAGLAPGRYQYRVRGYDTFGEASAYSKVHEVELPDLVPPVAPVISRFVTDRDSQPGKVFVNIHWRKEKIEPDMVGYDVFYFHEADGKEWQKMNAAPIAKTDTLYRCEVTDRAGGFFTVAAVDEKGNRGTSMPVELMLADYTPPTAPTGLQYVMSPSGVVLVKWNKNPEADVKGYQLFAANDTTHHFIQLPARFTTDTQAFDTLEIHGVNQRYIYYKVQAYDFSGNSSELSAPLQVKRLNYDKPERVRPDSIWLDGEIVYSRWIASHNRDIDLYRVYRRLDAEGHDWELISEVDPSVVKDEMLVVADNPDYARERYLYAVEAENTTHIKSGFSYKQAMRKQLPPYVEIPVVLSSSYDEKSRLMTIKWEVKGSLPAGISDYKVQVQRLTANGHFQTKRTLPSKVSSYSEYLAVDKAVAFRVVLLLPNGQQSFPSNEIHNS